MINKIDSSESDERRKIIGRRGIAKRISLYPPKVLCTCAVPMMKNSYYRPGIVITYCEKCQLVVSETRFDEYDN